jgi:hypothetical protein
MSRKRMKRRQRPMSARGMIDQEQAYCMVGGAIAAAIQNEQREPSMDPATRAVVHWLDTWLSPAEKKIVARYAQINFDQPGRSNRKRLDLQRLDLNNLRQAFYLIGKAIVLRIRHTESQRDPDIWSLLSFLDEVLVPAQKEFITRHAPIDFDAPGRPLPRFTDYEPRF